MPHNLIERIKYRVFLKSLRFRSPINIPLDKILVGQQNGTPSQNWFRQTGDKSRFSTLLQDSPYVLFLREVDSWPSLLDDDAALQKTSYYKMADLCRVYAGTFFNLTTPQEICQGMRQYYRLYRKFDLYSQTESIEDYKKPPSNSYLESHGHSAAECFPVVNKIIDSDMYEVEDGHHRLAIMLMKGYKITPVILRGKKRTFIQEELLRVNQTVGPELYQPVPLPEVQTWTLVRNCQDRFTMMMQFLKQKQLTTNDLSFLDCACSYGWFVKQFKNIGFNVIGLDKDINATKIGQLVYALEESDFQNVRLEKFLSINKSKFDIVLCLSILHHYAINKEDGSPEDILRSLTKITGKVLFIDTGQSHEQWLQKTLPLWNPAFIHSFLLKHGDFAEVVPLGLDKDNVGKFRDNYGRTLFACLKG